MDFLTQYSIIFLSLACLFGFFMAWGVGANDVANAMGTSVGSKALTIKQAIMIAVVFEFAGAFLAGGEVTSTIRKGMVDMTAIQGQPELLIYGMLSALLAAAIWLMVATQFGWPVSTTHSIVGAIVGFAAVGIGVDAVKWAKIGTIAVSWVASPLLAGSIAFVIFRSVQKLILAADDPFMAAQRYVPAYMFLTGFAISMVTFVKGLKHVGLDLGYLQSAMLAVVVAVLVAVLGKLLLNRVQPAQNREHRAQSVERLFAILMIFTACAMAFAHGSNDVANAIGPLAAIVSVIESGGEIAATSALPLWVLLLGASGIVFGLMTLGYKVIATIGGKITELTPSRGFAAELAAASTVVLASATGIPVSTTHTLVGAVLGVGLARGIGAIDLRVVATIFTSWLITLPAGGLLSIALFFVFKQVFSIAA
ncbi:MAG: inorganic phosphate transporter [Pseudomonadales bacterium]|nr:inorganic phosphate transporter [Pseudomonadales bacterium]